MYAAVPDLAAVAICTPPQVRHAFAREALAAGKHVMLEKPPTATVSELDDLAGFAAERGLVLFTTWHSQYNAAVLHARRLLEGETVKAMTITWKEDVRRWHPGQKWIWTAGGFGVFDPGINALSIVTEIMPSPVFVTSADLTFPSNCDAPIAASLRFRTSAHATRASSPSSTGGRPARRPGTSPSRPRREPGSSCRTAARGSRSTASSTSSARRTNTRISTTALPSSSGTAARWSTPAPLRLVADAFMVGRRLATDPFHD